MKVSTLQRRLEKRFKGSKSSIAYKCVKDVLTQQNNTFRVFNCGLGLIIRPTDSNKRGVVCYLDATVKILRSIGCKCEVLNDVPRGGANGNYIKITHKIDFEN